MTYMYLFGIGVISYWVAQKVFRILNLFVALSIIRLFFFSGLAVYLMAFHYHGNWANWEIPIVIAIVLANLLAEYPSIDYTTPVSENADDYTPAEESDSPHKHGYIHSALDLLLTISIANALFNDEDDDDFI